jgi:hypothetical protein
LRERRDSDELTSFSSSARNKKSPKVRSEKLPTAWLVSKKISNPSIARYGAGVGAAIWAMLGLGNAYATGLGRGVDVLVMTAVIVNVALIIAAALTFVNAALWRASLIAAMAVVIVNAIGTSANSLTVVSSVIVLIALIGITVMARRR